MVWQQPCAAIALGAEGFDDIRLFAKVGELVIPADPGANGLVGAWIFDEGTGLVK